MFALEAGFGAGNQSRRLAGVVDPPPAIFVRVSLAIPVEGVDAGDGQTHLADLVDRSPDLVDREVLKILADTFSRLRVRVGSAPEYLTFGWVPEEPAAVSAVLDATGDLG